ncbi:hypothetical protein NL676_021554 [Syzygium grande]|nr:hypothetical protein NL676_021554 [Syzygium grande]
MEREKPTSIVGTLVFLGSCCRSSVANPARQSEATEEDTNVDTDTATPVCYVSLDNVYSATTPCLTARGSSALMWKKIKTRKLPYVTNQSDGTKVEINRVDDPLCNGDNKGYNSGTSSFKDWYASSVLGYDSETNKLQFLSSMRMDLDVAEEEAHDLFG